MTVVVGQTASLPQCVIKNCNEGQQHQPPPTHPHTPPHPRADPSSTASLGAKGSGMSEAGMSWAEVFLTWQGRSRSSGPHHPPTTTTTTLPSPPPPSEHKDGGSRAELSRCGVSQAAHQCSVWAVSPPSPPPPPHTVFPAQPCFLLAAPSQRTSGGWDGCGVPPLHLVLHASVRMSACT